MTTTDQDPAATAEDLYGEMVGAAGTEDWGTATAQFDDHMLNNPELAETGEWGFYYDGAHADLHDDDAWGEGDAL
jgi:hypothetical protein